MEKGGKKNVHLVEYSGKEMKKEESSNNRELTLERNLKKSTSGWTFEESSSIGEYEVCLKISHEEDDYEVIKLTY